MKKLLLAVALLTATSAQALTHKECTSIGGLAKSVMDSRQSGVTISELLSLEFPSETADLVKAMAIDAYKEPHYSTEAYKNTSIVDFENEWYILCIEQPEGKAK